MGQERARQHEPIGLNQRSVLPIQQPPAPLLRNRQVPHQHPVVLVHHWLRQGQQTAAEALHTPDTPVKLATAKGIPPIEGFQAAPAIEKGPNRLPTHHRTGLEQGVQQRQRCGSGDVEQGRTVVDAKPGILPGTASGGAPPRAAAALPDRKGSLKSPAP
jgi:hypothetical protein